MKQIVHKAFWDHLESELNEDPPEYEHAIKLFEEIKEVSFFSLSSIFIRSESSNSLKVLLIHGEANVLSSCF